MIAIPLLIDDSSYGLDKIGLYAHFLSALELTVVSFLCTNH